MIYYIIEITYQYETGEKTKERCLILAYPWELNSIIKDVIVNESEVIYTWEIIEGFSTLIKR